jgi:DNA-binding CsgD family transcriptional regulator
MVLHQDGPAFMVDNDRAQPAGDLLSAGWQALGEGAWEHGRTCFQAAADSDATPEALEGLAMAAWWLDDVPVVFDSRERAYRLFRRRGDRLGAARVATWLGLDHYIYRGELAIANGWLQRAQRLLEGIEACAEHGWLAVWQAHIALLEHDDVATAGRTSAETVTLARSLGLFDLEMLALALEGLTLVSNGQVGEGMRRLDESTTAALAGEVADPDAIVTTCCYLIYACVRVRDFDRAAQWCAKVEQASRRWSYRSMLSVCRGHYAAVLIWRGHWQKAEAELTTATRELLATRAGWAAEGILRLAELRRRQGRHDDAAALFARMPGHPHALAGQAELAFDQGDLAAAADLVERFLRRVPPDNLTERAAGLELAVRIRAARGAIDPARAALAELDAAAVLVGTGPLRGSASLARGFVAAAMGDADAARHCFEDAVDLFEHYGAPFEAALARLALARVLPALDRHAAAASEARAALAVFQRLGAAHEAARAVALLHELGANARFTADMGRDLAGLTRREVDVLALVARGRSNQQIAEQLFISVRTVERHITTIYEKLGAEGRTARAIATAWAIEHGLTRLPA